MGKIIKKYHHKGTPLLPAKGESYVKNFSNSEILKRAKADPEAQPLTTEQLSKFKPADSFAKK